VAADVAADGHARERGRLLVLYDADCGLCQWLLAIILRWDRAGRLRPIALQQPEADELLGDLSGEQRMASWHLVLDRDERCSGGAALAPLLRALPGGRAPASVLARAPALVDRAYRLVAARRGQLSRWVPAYRKRRAIAIVRRREESFRARR
jgi:predicted DCC family thiol-disulfide oxidoreductase YuxK